MRKLFIVEHDISGRSWIVATKTGKRAIKKVSKLTKIAKTDLWWQPTFESGVVEVESRHYINF